MVFHVQKSEVAFDSSSPVIFEALKEHYKLYNLRSRVIRYLHLSISLFYNSFIHSILDKIRTEKKEGKNSIIKEILGFSS